MELEFGVRGAGFGIFCGFCGFWLSVLAAGPNHTTHLTRPCPSPSQAP